MNKVFKADDQVYFPSRSTRVLTLDNSNDYLYPISTLMGNLTEDGKIVDDDKLPSIYHATPETHELLEKLHGVKFEKPPTTELPK